MTVICAMKFNPKMAAIVADEQSSNYRRKYDIATKLVEADNGKVHAIAGGTGASDILYEIGRDVVERMKSMKEGMETNAHFANLVGFSMSQWRRRSIDIYLQNTFGISELEFQTGQRVMPGGVKIPITDFMMKQYAEAVSLRNEALTELCHNKFLILSFDSKNTDMYEVSMDPKNFPYSTIAVLCARPYGSAGSGSDIADAKLYEFYERNKRENYEDINPVSGIAAVLHATERASAINVGVGGTPLIKIMERKEDGKIQVTTPSSDNSRLASEIVKCMYRGYIPQEFSRRAIDDLIYKEKPFGPINDEFTAIAEHKQERDLFLRGYRV